MLKIFKAMWFLSMLAVLANLLYVYASLRDTVIVQDKGGAFVSLSRDVFFYTMTGVVALVNVLVYVMATVFKKETDFRSWFYGLVISINIFFIIALNFIALFNSGERFNYGDIDFVIYGSVSLFVLWALAWPVYLIYRKIYNKQSI